MRALSGREMEEVELRSVKTAGISLSDLMERAGAAVARSAERMAPEGSFVIISGKGNNGGDGMVAARLLAERGRAVRLFVLAQPETLSAEAKQAFERLQETLPRLQVPPEISVLESEKELSALREALAGTTLVIDCVFGFGLKGAARGLFGQVISLVNEEARLVLSVDVPSGVEGGSGRVRGEAIRATRTLTFTAPKLGLLVTPGAEYAGRIEVADIGVDPELVQKAGSVEWPQARDIALRLPKREFDAHKKSVGRVLVVAGSVGMTGAAAMTAQAAMRAGSGIVTLAIPQSLNPILESKLTEVMTVPMPETLSRSLLASGADAIIELCSSFDAVVVGPGLSLNESTVELVRTLVARVPLPMVLDADGLNAVVNKAELLKKRKGELIVTPHSGELARLLSTTTAEVQDDRVGYAKRAASEWRSTVVLKGAGTITSDGVFTVVNPTGNPGLATAGTGDVLSGIVGSLLAQGLEPLWAAASAVYLHGLAGDLAARELTEHCMLASDVISFLPKAFRRVERAREREKVG
ncbi:MAG: NAD(P)H-hydrate dehydratase [Actinobacteria bacterium]|nr:MAG: NAD(P)H-hydrate dehydratase [Actinomycetota bacterium]